MTLDKFSNDLVHIIPFDLGFMFFDELSINNKDSLTYILEFIHKLEDICYEKKIEIVNNIEVIDPVLKEYKFIDKKLTQRSICYAKLCSGLYCYILSSGIGVFVLADLNSSSLTEETKSKLEKYSPAFIAGYQKVITQEIILGDIKNTELLIDERNAMHQFMDLVWEATRYIVKKHPKRYVRRISSNSNYKHNGLSYVLTIYLIDSEITSDDQVNNLLYSSHMNQVLDESKWDQIEELLTQHKEYNNKKSIRLGDCEAHFSWSAVALNYKKKFNRFNDILEDEFCSNMIKNEIYVQSRWFLGDNTLDNFKLSGSLSLEKVLLAENALEITKAELESQVSANITSFSKQMVALIIETSEIRPLYDSVINQIKVQRSLVEARTEDAKRKNFLVLNILMSIFTAIELYKTINEFSQENFSPRNIITFVLCMFLAVVVVVVNFLNNRK